MGVHLKLPTYTIFCKGCEKEVTFDIQFEDDINIGKLRLGCHWCNDYAVLIGKDGIEEQFRDGYFTGKDHKILNRKPMVSFSFRIIKND